MYELPSTQIALAQPLFAPLDHHLGAQAVLNGTLPGTVWVDDCAAPRAAFTWLKHRVYLAGVPDSHFLQSARQFFDDHILPAAQAARRERFLVYYPPGIADQAAAFLQGVNFTEEWRLELEIEDVSVDWRPLLPEKTLLQLIDLNLLRLRGMIGRDAIIQAMTADRPSLEDALQHEFGYCLIRRRLIVARCLSEYAGAGRCEVGIITHPDFR